MKGKSIHKIKTKSFQIECNNCNEIIPSENININRSLGQCPNCNNVFAVDDDFFKHKRDGRQEIVMPEGTDVLHLPNMLDIQISWFKSAPKGLIGFLSFFNIMWNGILAFIVSSGPEALMFSIFHIAIGLVMLYWLASLFLNKTEVIVTTQYIDIKHGPLRNPFKPSIHLNSNEIKQLYVQKYKSGEINDRPTYAYALHAILNKGNSTQLLKGMDKDTQLYLEQEIEKHLNIKDQRVPNEIIS